jgi:hypothetical protein
VDRCLPTGVECPAPEAPAIGITVAPAVVDRLGGELLTITLDPPLPIERVRVGATPCVPERTAPFECRAPAWNGGFAAVDVIVDVLEDGVSRRVASTGAVRYTLPDFVEWPGDPLGPAIAILRDADRIVFARADAPPDVVPIAPWLTVSETLPIGAVAGLSLEDLDRDGQPELLGYPVEEVPFRASLTGEQTAEWWTPATPGLAARGVLLDVDGDGFSDLLGHTEQQTALEVERTLVVARGGPEGMRAEASRLPPPFDGGVIRAYAPIDADADGDTDAVICGDGLWLLIMEDGELVDAFAAEIPVPCGDVAVVDVNRDGRQDMAWVPALDYAPTPVVEAFSGVFLLRNLGENFVLATAQSSPPESFCGLNRAPTSTLSLGRSRIASFDVDLDGDVDLFLPAPYSQCAGGLVWYENVGDRFLARAVPGADANVQPRAVLATDLDGDGDLDVIVAAEAPGNSRVWRNLHVEKGGAARALIVRPVSDERRSLRGANVSLVAGGEVQHRQLANVERADAPLEAHFGLGPAEPPYTGVVRWPDGVEVFFEAAAPGVIEVPRPAR